MKLVKFCRKKLDKMVENGSLTPKQWGYESKSLTS
jgi:hypothetical protein